MSSNPANLRRSSLCRRASRGWWRSSTSCSTAAHKRAEPETSASAVDWRPWNDALAMVSPVADHETAESAYAIDAEIWRTHLVLAGKSTRRNGSSSCVIWWRTAADSLPRGRPRGVFTAAQVRMIRCGPPRRLAPAAGGSRMTSRPPTGKNGPLASERGRAPWITLP